MRKRDIEQVVRENFPNSVIDHISNHGNRYIIQFTNGAGQRMNAEIREFYGIPVINFVMEE